MSASPCLREVEPFFMQDCPLCGQANRMVVKGVSRYQDEKDHWHRELHPDIGYSFCNCKNIFYTRWENIVGGDTPDSGFHQRRHPLEDLRNHFSKLASGDILRIIMPDPFFCDWGNDPYEFLHWNPRANHTLWDMDQFCEEAVNIGFELVSADRDFIVDTKNPQTMEIRLRKP